MIQRPIVILAALLVSLTVNAQNKKVIFIMSAAKELKLKNRKTYPETGVFLSEFYLYPSV
jgi:uncharacterized membrane protein YciS (DUF1049 family)